MGGWHSYRTGRRYVGRLCGDEDLIQAVTELGIRERIATAAVTLTGRVTRWTVGTFDPRQQVYVTRTETRPMEIVVCRGLLSTGRNRPFFHAHIQLADENTVVGGRLFSKTLAADAECIVEEFCGPATERIYDADTGQLALTFLTAGGRQAGLCAGPFKEGTMEITITRADTLKAKPDPEHLGFGNLFTDHMFNMDYDLERGWHQPRIEPYGAIAMDPSTMVLHYGQGVFEGLKAYRAADGRIQLFRPRDNFRRLNNSSRLLCIPAFDEAFMLQALKTLLQLEKDWVPAAPETSLYIRPTIIAMDPFLGVRASHTYRFFIILSPVGAYYPEGFDPIKIQVTREHVRAVRGGVGEAKTLGNYAASLLAGDKAHQEGYTQVLWLDGVELKYVEEVGSMNIFFVIDDELVTPALNGSILPGITRDSVLALGRKWGLKVTERQISIDEVMTAHDNGHLKEIFGSGTAAVISPVGELNYAGRTIQVGDGHVGPLARKLYKAITDIQYGTAQDDMGWVEPV